MFSIFLAFFRLSAPKRAIISFIHFPPILVSVLTESGGWLAWKRLRTLFKDKEVCWCFDLFISINFNEFQTKNNINKYKDYIKLTTTFIPSSPAIMSNTQASNRAPQESGRVTLLFKPDLKG